MSQHIAADLALLAYEATFPERGFPDVSAPTLASTDGRAREALDVLGFSWARIVAHAHSVHVNVESRRTFADLLTGTGLEEPWARRRSPALTTNVTPIDGALVPGLSGAPLMRGFGSERPEIVALGQGGFVNGGSDDTFAIPVSLIREFLEQLPARRNDLDKLHPRKNSGHFAMATDEMNDNMEGHAHVHAEVGPLGVYERQLDGASGTRLGVLMGVSWDLDPASPTSTLVRLQAGYSYGWTWGAYVAPDGTRGRKLAGMAHDLWLESAIGVHFWRIDAWSLSIDGGVRLGVMPDFYFGLPLTARLRNDRCVLQLRVVGAYRPTYDTHYTGFLNMTVDDAIGVTSVAVEGSFAILLF